MQILEEYTKKYKDSVDKTNLRNLLQLTVYKYSESNEKVSDSNLNKKYKSIVADLVERELKDENGGTEDDSYIVHELSEVDKLNGHSYYTKLNHTKHNIIHKSSAVSQSLLSVKEDIHWNPERRNPLDSNSSSHALFHDQNIKRPRDKYVED